MASFQNSYLYLYLFLLIMYLLTPSSIVKRSSNFKMYIFVQFLRKNENFQLFLYLNYIFSLFLLNKKAGIKMLRTIFSKTKYNNWVELTMDWVKISRKILD